MAAFSILTGSCTPLTVKNHVSNFIAKLGLHARTQAILYFRFNISFKSRGMTFGINA
ncbi:LuxR C-terminal-related transcriptional regulator [Paenibacillus guangzhouensis]|uniref:LuxR C-terminal-related transcriptional regulator n=1 Tax=Paenibacillus guangzhouensis TaxID=1473112 RepID=UPI00126692D0